MAAIADGAAVASTVTTMVFCPLDHGLSSCGWYDTSQGHTNCLACSTYADLPRQFSFYFAGPTVI